MSPIAELLRTHPVSTAGNRHDFNDQPLSEQWQAQQDAALSEYEGDQYAADHTLAHLFGGFMAVSLDRNSTVLDIGCGIGRKLPAYVEQLNLSNYIGLDPYKVDVLPEYPMLAGALAENLPLKDASVDAVIFSTSMDHIEGIDQAIAEAKRVLKPGGRIYMWIGLYDPRMIARIKTFDVIWRGGALKKALRFLGAQAEYAHTLWRMRDRARKLEAGTRIDQYHCRYYTRDRVSSDLERWGLRELRSALVPGTESLFVEAGR